MVLAGLAALPLDQDDPADARVDADIVTDGTWQQNAAVLSQRYGVIYRSTVNPVRMRFIEVSPCAE